jgi:hypothetical protein
MQTSRSSTFSSETLRLHDRPRPAWRSPLLLALALVCAAEGVARLALAPIGEYWRDGSPDAAVKFETYRAWARQRTVPRTVIVGDSTGARDLDPTVMGASLRSPDVYNLAWPANYALAFRDCTLPLFRSGAVPETLVVSLAPHAFVDVAPVRRFERAITSSPYCRHLIGAPLAGDYVYLARLRHAWPFRRSWWTGAGLPAAPAELGFMPLDGSDVHRYTPLDTEELATARFRVMDELSGIARDRGIRLVVILPPRIDPRPSRVRLETAYLGLLRALDDVTVFDYRDLPFLWRRHFFDDGHLNRTGARLLSARLAADLHGARTAATLVRARAMAAGAAR